MRLLTTKEAAAKLNMSPEFLERDRWAGATIPFIRIGMGAVRYAEDDIEQYMQARRSTGNQQLHFVLRPTTSQRKAT